MDTLKLTELLRATIDPNPEQRKAAEDQLSQVGTKKEKIIQIFHVDKMKDINWRLCHWNIKFH